MSYTLGIIVGMKSEEKILTEFQPPFSLIACAGANADRAELMAQQLVKRGATALLSIGVVGGLDPQLKVGDVIFGTKVILPDRRELICTLDLDAPSFAYKCAVAGSNTALLSPLTKATLFKQTGAAVVDMESHGVARAARDLNLPFGVVRVVSDTASTAIPSFALLGIQPDGSLNPLPMIPHLFRHFHQIPTLLRLQADTNRALKVLRRVAQDILTSKNAS
ncbi:MAG: hypothetical protein R3E60_01585 [Alphaproteobacteria bacterium]